MCSLPLEPPTHSIVEYFHSSEVTGRSCGYCKSQTGSFSDGMWAHAMSPENYESLINIGWRRSGCYLYKPRNNTTCCPVYTIRNLSGKVEITRSQRKVLKRFKKYLTDGVMPNKEKYSEDKPDYQQDKVTVMECGRDVADNKEIKLDKSPEQVVNAVKPKSNAVPEQKSDVSKMSAPSLPKKDHPLKKKFLRREKKRQKLIAKGLDPAEFFKRNERNRVNELREFFTPKETDKVQFTTKLIQVDSPEFEKVFPIEHKLYMKYQMHTHKDTEHDCRASQFRRFLCDNPFGAPTNLRRVCHGTFHNHYYMNDKLVAVGVIDILPSCISSVYFFYDPEYSFLSPGSLGALHEIYFVNNLTTHDPSLQYYYLGYYIHKCDKMKYKRKFRPCELLCPVYNQFLSFDDRVLNLLDESASGFEQLSHNMNQKPLATNHDVGNVLILHNRRVLPFERYPKHEEERNELEEYVTVVTSRIASNMLLYRS